MGCGIFGLLPTSILGEVGDSLPSASDRYTYTVSVPVRVLPFVIEHLSWLDPNVALGTR